MDDPIKVRLKVSKVYSQHGTQLLVRSQHIFIVYDFSIDILGYELIKISSKVMFTKFKMSPVQEIGNDGK